MWIQYWSDIMNHSNIEYNITFWKVKQAFYLSFSLSFSSTFNAQLPTVANFGVIFVISKFCHAINFHSFLNSMKALSLTNFCLNFIAFITKGYFFWKTMKRNKQPKHENKNIGISTSSHKRLLLKKRAKRMDNK